MPWQEATGQGMKGKKMLLTLYPNGELRARKPPPPLAKTRSGGSFVGHKRATTHILSVVSNLRSEFGEAPFKPPKAETKKPGFGASPKGTAFTRRAKRTLERTGGVIGELGGRESVLFLTGTIPGGTVAAFKAVSDWSSWICHELVTHLPRIGRLVGSEYNFLWVWEWQKRGALHWHCIFECKDRVSAQKIKDGFKCLWIRVLETVGRKAGIDIAERAEGGTHAGRYGVWRTRAEWARKNPSRYLAKYMAKAKTPESTDEKCYFPTRWYSCSRALLVRMRSRTVSVSTHCGTEIPEHVIDEELDLGTIEKMFGFAPNGRGFSDKFRDGQTFIFYLDEKGVTQVAEMIEEFKTRQKRAEKNPGIKAERGLYPCLSRIVSHRRAFDRFVSDIGATDLSAYLHWVDGIPVPDSDIGFLENYAHRILIWEGFETGVIPPTQGAGLTGQGVETLESRGVAQEFIEQLSLFP